MVNFRRPGHKFACVILVHWHVILIMCNMTRKQLMSNMQRTMENTPVWLKMVLALAKIAKMCKANTNCS